MSTFPITAREIAPVVAFLADPSVAEILHRALVANRSACAADGWKPSSDMDEAPAAADIIAACPADRPTDRVALREARRRAAQAIRSLWYNCASNGANHLSPEDDAALEELFLRVMDGVRLGPYRSAVDNLGPCPEMNDHLKIADHIRAARAA